jgi:pimeloyl-ACP methyl ester carboxylesterase
MAIRMIEVLALLTSLVADPPRVTLDSVFIDSVKRGSLIRKVDGYGIIRLPAQAVIHAHSEDVRLNLPAVIDVRQGLLHGRVSHIETDSITLTIADAPRTLVTDQRAAASIQVNEIKDVLIVTATPLLLPDASISLFRIGTDTHFADRVPVRTGNAAGGNIEIRAGLSAGDRVIISQLDVSSDTPRIRLEQPTAAPPAQTTAPGRMVDAGGYKIRLLVDGAGPQTVVFIAGGFGGRFGSWLPVANKVKAFARIVLYDRGGTGLSEAAPPPRDSKHIALELRTALKNSGLPPPYVIAGQSIGGIHARVFAHEYPKDTAALVLIDPTSEDFEAEQLKARPEASTDVQEQTARMAAQAKGMPQGMRYEFESLETDFIEARESWPLPSIPATLITSLHPGADILHVSPMVWLDLHQKFAARAGAKHIITETLGHNMQNEDPGFVAETIHQVVAHIH